MQTWKWLYHPRTPADWRFIRNVLVKTAILFVAVNVVFVLADPLPALGKFSAYNVVFKGRERLPYGENPDVAYNLSLYQIDAMFASHELAGADHHNEYRVLLIGDSSVWGILLRPEETLAGQLNTADYHTADGRPIRFYNLGYPTMSLIKDLMLLDYAMRYQPDLIVWSFTLESFGTRAQLDSAIVQNNPDRVRGLIKTYDLQQNPDDIRFVEHSEWDNTVIGKRRELANLLRLQLYGAAWTITGIDQEYRTDYTPHEVDLKAETTWHGLEEATFSADDLAFDILRAGAKRADGVPMLLINEPMFISEGQNSAIRYNAFFPQWTYDTYRQLLHEAADQQQWELLDLWDTIPDTECYTDSAVHLTPACSTKLAQIVGPVIVDMANTAGNEQETS